MKCRQCNESYDRDEIIITNGIEFAMKGFCCSFCYTEYMTEGDEMDNNTFNALLKMAKALAEVVANSGGQLNYELKRKKENKK